MTKTASARPASGRSSLADPNCQSGPLRDRCRASRRCLGRGAPQAPDRARPSRQGLRTSPEHKHPSHGSHGRAAGVAPSAALACMVRTWPTISSAYLPFRIISFSLVPAKQLVGKYEHHPRTAMNLIAVTLGRKQYAAAFVVTKVVSPVSLDHGAPSDSGYENALCLFLWRSSDPSTWDADGSLRIRCLSRRSTIRFGAR